MRKVYIAGSFYKKENSLKDDFRSELLGNEDILWNECDNAQVTIFNETMKYVGPFFYYPEKEKEFKKMGLTEQEVVVTLEKLSVEKCDVFIAYFGTKSSPGTVAELIHAAKCKKDIYVFYLRNENNRRFKSEYWFPILLARKIAKENKTNFLAKEVSNARHFMNFLTNKN